MTAPALELKKTPLNAVHRVMGGRMVDFGGWDMPVQYPAGTVEEHLRTRTHAGLFDVSHMGEIDVRGADAIRSSTASLQTTCRNWLTARRNTRR